MSSAMAQMSTLASATGLMVFISYLCCRSTMRSCSISNDFETLWIGNKGYEFMCCTYSDAQRGRLLNKKCPIKAGEYIGKIADEKLYVRALQHVDTEEYLAVTGAGGTVDLFKRIK